MKTLRNDSIQAEIALQKAQKAAKAAFADMVEKARLVKASEEAFTASCKAWKALPEAYAEHTAQGSLSPR